MTVRMQSAESRLWELCRTKGSGSSGNNYKEKKGVNEEIGALNDRSNSEIGELNLVFRMDHKV